MILKKERKTMKKLGKILALVLAASLVLSLVACGGNKSSDGDVLTIFAPIGGSDGLSVLDEEIVNKFKEKTGIQVEIEFVAYSGFAEKLQLMLASGEYPDVAQFPSTTLPSYIDAVESGIVVDLQEYLTEKNAPNLMKYTYEAGWDNCRFFGDDRIMAIPRTSLLRNEGVAIRADWLDKIGYGEVLDRQYHEVTDEEFMEIMKRMTFNDPDGNGKNDTIATSCWADDATKQYGPMEFARGFYGDYGWYEYEGDTYKYMKPQFSKDTDIFKNQLQFTQDAVKAGVLDPDGPSLTKTNVQNNILTGAYGIAPHFSGHLASTERQAAEIMGQRCPTRDNYIDYIYAADENGKVAGNGYYTPMYGQYCVFETCEDPNNFVQLCDFLLSDEIWELVTVGREGLTHNMVNGYREDVTLSPGARPVATSFPDGIVRRAGDAAYFTGSKKVYEKTAYMMPYLEKAFQISQDTLVTALDNGFVPTISSDTAFINYNSTMAEKITNICSNKLAVSEYDKVLDGWYKAGGQQYVEEMNEYIAKNQALKAE